MTVILNHRLKRNVFILYHLNLYITVGFVVSTDPFSDRSDLNIKVSSGFPLPTIAFNIVHYYGWF